ncbi:MAG: tRNA (adenosine(37)-N6)-threonylcarbamoyltransferase complex ATPase subunit type 1 TsaE [Anaerolineae bacterium]|nr:tRNA (adenosine(37)-N6)-threonylcarbamoyltransferase complex ATPase subunit type 1 TsaE [Anaerolineae bacterium]
MTPLPESNVLEFVSYSPEQTRRLGVHLGTLVQGGTVLCLEGPLGSGKTCLTQGIGEGFGVTQPLISPTFVLVREYPRGDGLKLYHVDLYRISGPGDAFSLGVEEWLGHVHAVFVIEWAERMRELIPPDHLWVRLDFAGDMEHTQRALHFTAWGERHRALLQRLRAVLAVP